MEGKEEVLSIVYADNYDLLFDYGLRFTADVQIVEDSIQEVFINIIKYRNRMSLVKNVQGYLLTAFRRQLFLYLNKQKKNISIDQLPEFSFDYFKCSSDETSDKEEDEYLYSTINECINNLTIKQREIIYLRFEREISYEEIAEILNISIESCYKSIYRTIKIIRSAAERKIIKDGNSLFSFSHDQILKMKLRGN